MTIRRIAQEFGVTPMALYWHVKNKDELLAAMGDRSSTGLQLRRRSCCRGTRSTGSCSTRYWPHFGHTPEPFGWPASEYCAAMPDANSQSARWLCCAAQG